MDKEIFPKMEIFNPVARVVSVAKFIAERLLTIGNDEVPYAGGAAMLDESLYDQVQVKGFLYDGTRE